MSKTTATSKTAKCMYCGKQAAVTPKGLLAPHMTPGAMRCIGAGMKPREADIGRK